MGERKARREPAAKSTYFVHSVLFHAKLPSVTMRGFWSCFKFLLLEGLVFLKNILSQLVYVDVLLVPRALHGLGSPSLLLLAHVILEGRASGETVLQPARNTNDESPNKKPGRPPSGTPAPRRAVARTTKSGSVSQSSAPPTSCVTVTAWPADAFHI